MSLKIIKLFKMNIQNIHDHQRQNSDTNVKKFLKINKTTDENKKNTY